MIHLYFTQMDPLPDRFSANLEARGWLPHHLPFRQVVYLLEPTQLVGYDAVIVTSKQAARWLNRASVLTSQIRLAVVGRASSAELPPEQLLWRNAPANATQLVERLLMHFPNRSKFLFLRGEQALNTVASGLENHELTQLVVYRCEKVLKKDRLLVSPNMVYFQAPSTVVDYLEVYRHPPKCIGAIGKTTAQAVKQVGWHIDFQPSRPENTCFTSELPSPQLLGFSS